MNWRDELAVWTQAALQLVFPCRCPGCGRELAQNGAWCEDCLRDVWKPRRLDVQGRGMKHVSACQVLVGYEGNVRNLLHGLKFARRRSNAAPLAWLISMADGEELGGLPAGDVLAVPVPLSAERFEERGFNQVELIFASWCAAQDCAWLGDALVRRRPTLPQWELDRTERRENMKGAFVVTRPESIRDQSILLLDDIVTTGRTLEECATALRRAGAASVHALALANG